MKNTACASEEYLGKRRREEGNGKRIIEQYREQMIRRILNSGKKERNDIIVSETHLTELISGIIDGKGELRKKKEVQKYLENMGRGVPDREIKVVEIICKQVKSEGKEDWIREEYESDR